MPDGRNGTIVEEQFIPTFSHIFGHNLMNFSYLGWAPVLKKSRRWGGNGDGFEPRCYWNGLGGNIGDQNSGSMNTLFSMRSTHAHGDWPLSGMNHMRTSIPRGAGLSLSLNQA